MQDIGERLSILEQRVNSIYQIMHNMENTLLVRNDKLENEIKELREEIKKIKDEIKNINIKINAIIDQLDLFAPIDRVKSIEKLLDIIDPLNFVTKNEIDKIVEKKVKELLGKL